MKLTIDGCEVSITVKNQFTGKHTKSDDMNLLNLLSLYASQASKQWKTEGADALARGADRIADEIYDQLKAAGCYA